MLDIREVDHYMALLLTATLRRCLKEGKKFRKCSGEDFFYFYLLSWNLFIYISLLFLDVTSNLKDVLLSLVKKLWLML